MAIAAVGSVLLLLLFSPIAAAAAAPHVATTPTPDTCAMCHRAHTAPGDFGRIAPDSWEMESTALGIATPTDSGDTALCYVCHGVDALGSGTPVGASFEATSAHSLAPVASAFGPSVKYCSSCHDSHGTAELAPGVSFAALLRARTSDGTQVYRESQYCGTCHEVRETSRFPGVAVYEQTTHFANLPDPASGTQIRCSNCHEEHGSPLAPLVVTEVTPPASGTPVAVTANDRTFCLSCHSAERGTFAGEDAYEASAHATSEETVDIAGEWAEEDATRLVGECQVCHAPMGRDDGEGAPIPTLLDQELSELCLSCHDADGAASTDLASLLYPATSAADLELVAGFSAETTTAAFSTVAVWGSLPGDAPRELIGPRLYDTNGTPGVVAVGDADGDGRQDVVVADTDDNNLMLLTQDPLKGLSSYSLSEIAIGGVADYLVIADVVDNGQPEICLVSDGTLYVYRYDTLGPESIATLPGLGLDITGLAAGDLDGDGFAELVVTDGFGAQVHVLTEGATPGTVVPLYAAISAKSGVRGPSIGEIDASSSGPEIAVVDREAGRQQVSVYSAAGGFIRSLVLFDDTAPQRPQSTLIADVLPGLTPAGTSGHELVVAVDGGLDASSLVVVLPQLSGGGFDTDQQYGTGVRFGTTTLAAGDIDGDGDAELVAGSGGYWSREAALATPPSIQVFNHDAERDAFDPVGTLTLAAGGVERAGRAPWLAIADLGGVGPSRHPVNTVEDAHEAQETTPMTRHVECADCHNAHEADDTTAAAPAAYGRIKGTWGATGALADAQPIAREYELCYKCHSAYQDPAAMEGATDISALVDPGNASVHAVEQSVDTTANAETFVTGWGNASVLYCTDCHSTAEASPSVAGPHVSSEAPILRSPYLGTTPADSAGLCYDCHKYAVYFTGAADTNLVTGSFFRDAGAGPLHELHANDHGFGCASCHESHGSPDRERLIRSAIVFDETARSCTGPCHPGGITYTP